MGFLNALGGILRTAAPFASFIPGVGPLVGAGLGIGGGLLGGAMQRAGAAGAGRPDPAANYRSRLADRLMRQGSASPTDDPAYQAGAAELRTQSAEQAGIDGARLAATGATGGEGEIAMAANRGRNLSGRLVELVGQSGARQGQADGLLAGMLENDRDREQQGDATRAATLTSAAGTVAGALGDYFTRTRRPAATPAVPATP
jgi:hypothetical protein